MKIYWHNDKKNIIGEKVRFQRENHIPPLTQIQLSAKLEHLGVKMDRLAISRLEKGNRFAADYEIAAIAKALDVEIKDILSLDDL